jgi:hypothetical protein
MVAREYDRARYAVTAVRNSVHKLHGSPVPKEPPGGVEASGDNETRVYTLQFVEEVGGPPFY